MSTAVDKSKVPWWVSNLIVPLVNLTLALLVSALFIFIAGENPVQAIKLIIYGSFGYLEGFAYTLYYTTNFIFTGLAFAVAFHCRLFNIGGEGQAYIGGLGVFLVAINFGFSLFNCSIFSTLSLTVFSALCIETNIFFKVLF